MTTVYLVRHAHADWRPDEARTLSAKGFADAKAVGALFDGVRIDAIYSSPALRAMQTVELLAQRLRIAPVVLADLRERELPVQGEAEFGAAVESAWGEPDRAAHGGESNTAAQARGIAVVRQILERHPDQGVVVATHGNLLALILSVFDSRLGYQFWRGLTFPDVYELQFAGSASPSVRRLWVPL